MSASAPPVSTEVLQEAAGWVARMRAPDIGERERRELMAWLRRSPVHVQHYLELVSLDVDLDDADLYAGLTADGADGDRGTNVLPLTAGTVQPPGAPAVHRRRWRSPGAIAAALAVMAIVPGIFLGSGWWQGHERYHSALGELRSIVLDDGSIVTLNTQSNITVRYSTAVRAVQLRRGEALFRVARHRDRPFRVSVDGVVIEALGTAFNIYRKPTGAVLTVVEGRVTVSSSSPPPAAEGQGMRDAPAILSAGDQLDLTAHAAARRLDANELARITTWTQRRLRFDQTPVSEVVIELNRYNRDQLIVEDPALARRVITGTFEANDLASFVLFLEREADATLRRDGNGTLRLVAAREGGER